MQLTRKIELSHPANDAGQASPDAADRNGPDPALELLWVLSVTSEIYPVVKTGGLADVAGSLPKALVAEGIRTKTLMPAYPAALEKCSDARAVGHMSLLGEEATLLSARCDGLNLLLLHCPALYDRRGGPYLDETGRDHHDNWRRFAALSLAAARIAAEGVEGWRPGIVHLHDWQAALAAGYMRAAGVDVPTVLTIHNLAFQGQFPAGVFPALGLPDHFFSVDCLEYYHDISFLKAGIRLSDAVTTVSPSYAREILTEEHGMGMSGVLQTRRDVLSGIVNGIDQAVWDPLTDPYIPLNYDIRSLGRRRTNRRMIERQFGLKAGDGPIISVVSRLTWQKGIDLLAPVVPGLVDRGARLIVIGEGDPAIVYPLLEQARHHSGRVVVRIGYSEETAHLLHAGSDIVVQPSRFEPCGLTQLYALRYGAVPVVARTGGLAETVIDANEAAMAAGAATGFHFQPGSVEDLYHALDRALTAFGEPDFWRQLQTQAMRTDFGWARSAERYARLYRQLAETRAAQTQEEP